MKKIIGFQWASKVAAAIFILLIVFHAVVIAGIVFFDFAPVEYLWGGRMENAGQLLQFEIISLLTTSLALWLVLAKSGKSNAGRLLPVVSFLMWLLVVLFALNTLGNLTAQSFFEQLMSIPTALLTVLCLRIALGK